MAAIFEFVTACNKASPSSEGAAAALAAFNRFEDVLAVFGDEPTSAVSAPSELLDLLEQRKIAKGAKDWATADQIRDQIAAAGWRIVDAAEGARLERT